MALVSTLPALWAARTLALRPDFSELLPENRPSAVELRRVNARLTSATTLTLVALVPAPHPQALDAFADAVIPRIRDLGPRWVGAIDAGNGDNAAFFARHELLYAPLDEVRALHEQVRERYDYEVQKRAGIDLSVDEPPPLPSASTLRALAGPASGVPSPANRHYIGEDGKLLAILIRTPVEPGSVGPATSLRAKVEAIVADVRPASFDPKMEVRFTGDAVTSVEEYQAVKDDLSHVGLAGVLLVLGAVFFFFLRLRTLLAMGITIAIGLAWTFGAARLMVGYLNSSTGFLVSIIAGNGINFGIIYMARYLELRRAGDGSAPSAPGSVSAERAVALAHRDTRLATFAAAVAAAVAYGSLAVTDFRGFKHFGIIGGTGMILCWVATYAFLPVILVLSERARPMTFRGDGLAARIRGAYGRGFAFAVERFPRGIAIAGIVIGVAALVASVRYFVSNPMEYDLTKLRTRGQGRTPASLLSQRVDAVVGRLGQEGIAVVVDRIDQVAAVKAALERRRDAAPPSAKPFDRVFTVFDVLPKDQSETVPLLDDMRDLLLRARARGMIGEREWAELEPFVPSAPLAPIGIADLPEQVARPFTENDGTRGCIVYVVPRAGSSIWDGHYLQLWADSFRTIPLPNGEVIHGSGRAVIFADMLQVVVEDAPKAVVVSLAGTALVVLVAFRGRRSAWAVLLTLLLGVLAMTAFLGIARIKLNFLNFVALPITFGIGVDYAVNVMQRIRADGTANMHRVVAETGGAVALCSLTTTLGYLSLALSTNGAIVSFGCAAAAGEVACLLAAVLVMPATMLVLPKVRASLATSSTRPRRSPAAR